MSPRQRHRNSHYLRSKRAKGKEQRAKNKGLRARSKEFRVGQKHLAFDI